jgi:hypothetical protein
MNKSTLEYMLESSKRGELGDNLNSLIAQEILQNGIELFETVEAKNKLIINRVKELEAKDAEIERLKSELTDLNIHAINIENGDIDLIISGINAKIFYSTVVQIFKQNGGKNFYTIAVESRKKGEKYALTIQNCNRALTPAEKMEQMKREIEGLQEIRQDMAKLNEFMSTKISKPGYAGRPCVDTVIEEIELLKRENDNLHCQDCAKQAFEVACLLQEYKEENERLKAFTPKQIMAQNAAIKNILKAIEHDHFCGSDEKGNKIYRCLFCGDIKPNHLKDCYLNKVLSMNATDYHNPADVEALKKAKEILVSAHWYYEASVAFANIDLAIKAIDKAIGGEYGTDNRSIEPTQDKPNK